MGPFSEAAEVVGAHEEAKGVLGVFFLEKGNVVDGVAGESLVDGGGFGADAIALEHAGHGQAGLSGGKGIVFFK